MASLMDTEGTESSASPQMDFAVMQERAEEAADFLKSLASKPRLLILCALVSGPRLAGELGAILAINPANLSQHLTRLRDEGLVRAEREGNTMRYSLASDRVEPFINALHGMFCDPGQPLA